MASSSSSSSSSSSLPKKDIAASAGEIASSFFDRLKKSTSERAKNSNSSNSTGSSSSPAAELIANLAQNLIVNATSNSSTSNTSSSSSGNNNNSSAGSILFSKLLGDQKKAAAPRTLKIYDDDNLDDSDFDISKISAAPVPSKLRSVSSAASTTSTPPPIVTTTSASALPTPSPSSASVSIDGAASSSSLASLASSLQSGESASLVSNSKSELDMNKLTVFQNKPSPTANEPEPKMSTSSSLHLISSVIDDFMKKDIAHTVVDTATNEAAQLRKKLWTKKKSIESSIENMKAKAKLTKSVSEIIKDPSSLAQNDETPSSTDQKTPEGSFKRITLDESMKSLSEESPNEIPAESRRSISQVKTTRSLSETVMFDADDEEQQPQVAADLKEKIANDNNEMITSATSTQTNQGEATTRTGRAAASLDRKLIAGAALVMIIALSIIYKNISLVVLTFFFGLTLGSLATALVLYLAQKFNLIPSFGSTRQHAATSRTTHDETTNSSSSTSNSGGNSSSSRSSIQQIASLLIQTPIPKENKNFNGVYKGWMNELREVYDPEKYFLNKTRSVYLNLDGIMLRIQTTTSRVPKRALPGEHIANVTFNEQRHYDLTGCEVIILPAKLCRKRFWSKKYPICLKGVKLLNSKGLGHSNSIASDITSISHSSSSSASTPREENNNTITHEPLEKNTLILFARTDREKEEWYNLFRKASAKKLQDSIEYLKKKRSQQMSTSHSVTTTTTTTTSGSLAVDKIAFEVSNNKLIYKVNSKPDLASTSSEATNKNNQAGVDTSSEQTTTTTETNALSTTRDTQTDNGLLYDSTVAFINTFMIRAFADFFTHKHWIDRIQNKIQNKLSMIRVPYFMEELKITGLDLGTIVPIIKRSSEPWCDEKGLWVHLEIDYSGGLQMSLSTKLNLMKLKSNSSHQSSSHNQQNNHHHSSHSPSNLSPMSTSNSVPIFTFKNDPKSEDASVSMIGSHFSAENSSASASRDSNMNADASSKSSSLSSSPSQGPAPIEQLSVQNDDKKKRSFSTSTTAMTTRKKVKNLGTYDSNEEDSPESSGDEYVHNGFGDEENKLVETANASKKFLGLVNKIAASNYFQKATENKYIKMAMENVSNCQLLLNVELKKISGTLALNIPPHPSDRIWYGFVTNPQMVLVATPQVGEKEVSYSAITDWIADKLKIEFQKVLVFPNMDDLYIPILNSEINI